jgi:hypothetical protein
MKRLLLAGLLLAADPAWERELSDPGDIRRMMLSGDVIVVHYRSRLDTFELATGKPLASISLAIAGTPPGAMANPEFAGNTVLVQASIYDLKTGRAVATDAIEGVGRVSGQAFYSWSGDKLVKTAAAGHPEWSLLLKDIARSSILPASDGGAVLRVAAPKGGTEAAKTYVSVSPAGKIEWSVPIPEADQAGMEQIRNWSFSAEGKDLYLLCGKIKATDHALWTAVIDGRAKRIVVKDVTLPHPRVSPQAQVVHVVRRDGAWYGIGSGEVDVEVEEAGKKRKVKAPGLVVVNLSEGKELRRVAAGLNLEAPPGYAVWKENEVFDAVANKSLGKLGTPAAPQVWFSRSYAFVKEGPKMSWVALAGGDVKMGEFQGSLARTVGDVVAAQGRDGQKTVVGYFDLEKGTFEKVKSYEGGVQSWIEAETEGWVLVGVNAGRTRELVAAKRPK